MKENPIEAVYVITMEEIVWGGVLVAITMAMHGFGMLMVLRINHYIKKKIESKTSLMWGLLPLIFVSCLVMVVHLTEVLVWAAFFFWKGAFPNPSTSFYFALNEYTTVGSKFDLPMHWRLLEGMIASAGLLTFAISTGILFGQAKTFLEQPIEVLHLRRRKPASHKTAGSDKETGFKKEG